MKARVEDSDLRNFRAKCISSYLNAFQIYRVVQRSKDGHALDGGFDTIIHDDGLIEFDAAMDHAVSHSVDFRRAFRNRWSSFSQKSQQVLDALS